MRALGADEIDWPGIIAADRAGEDVGATDPHLLKLTIDDFVLLDAVWGKQDDDHRSTELIDGRIYHTPARYGSRVRPTMKLLDAFREAVKLRTDGLWVGSRGSIASPPYDLPLPDIVLTYEPNGEGFIPAASVPLVVEVADNDAALQFFLGEKLRCYARMGVAEYWMSDVNKRVIHQFSMHTGALYTCHKEVLFGQPVIVMALAGLSVATTNYESDRCLTGLAAKVLPHQLRGIAGRLPVFRLEVAGGRGLSRPYEPFRHR